MSQIDTELDFTNKRHGSPVLDCEIIPSVVMVFCLESGNLQGFGRLGRHIARDCARPTIHQSLGAKANQPPDALLGAQCEELSRMNL